jgi:hypothetical protein
MCLVRIVSTCISYAFLFTHPSLRDILDELSTLPLSSVTEYQNEIMYPAGVNDLLPINGKETLGEALLGGRLDVDSDMMIYSS